MTAIQSFHAVTRFGLGPRGNEIAEVGNDPAGWIMNQLRNPTIPPEVTKRLGGTDLTVKALKAMRKKNAGEAQEAVISMRDIYVQETAARFTAQVHSTQPFVERLVLFFSNHFTVSIQKPFIAGLANAYEVEAIRPHINGYFRDMLFAAVRHPAMLFYLDNVQSFGPDSRGGERRGKGLNENLAREILELHTLGVDGGYTQADVTAFANILTGWTLERGEDGPRVAFGFQPVLHEPGPKILLGKRYEEEGEQEGIKALTMLAQHPSTARHLARKLARHFVADEPPQTVVDRLTQVYLQSNGHIPTIMNALVGSAEAWQAPLTKVKNPYEYALSVMRLLEHEPEPKKILGSLEALNFRAFNATSPAGYDDTAAAWVSPDALNKRIEWARSIGQKMPGTIDPLALAERAIGPVLSATTRETIQRAASGADGIAFLFSSPEFQRR